ncbi:hypothetical protein [Pseudoalteromonas sp. A2]|uniref:hypothetical protein n=1 Tax=Pseudoalteromonas sp. A2 TaxID=1523412 RepID=UPI0005633C34|nr:hypothetical protein [Pseudoalteromonas sp. A2]
MLVYLDQNKWIHLAKIINGKETSESAINLLQEIKASLNCGYIYPLSAFHYMEFARISNNGRRQRLGKVMWDFSKNQTLVSSREIVIHELEISLSKFFPEIKPKSIRILGNGMFNAFGVENDDLFPTSSSRIDEVMLTGKSDMDIEPMQHFNSQYRKNFQDHLKSLHQQLASVEKINVNNWLNAFALKDISEPLTYVLSNNGISEKRISNLNAEDYAEIINAMPTRALDVHLHKQVLKNKTYNSKLSDLEDWAGLGMAACYCDIVVCEKHFADMLKRDGYKTKARVVTNMSEIFETIA